MENVATTQENRVRKEMTKGPLVVSRVYVSNYQKEGTLTAEIKQTIVTKSHYPSKSVTSNLQDNPFSTEEFGFEDKEYTSEEKRVVWVDVPVGSTEETVKAKLAALPSATIYRVLANKPILSDNQKYGISAGLTSLEAIADRQAVRYPEGHPQAGKLILDSNGKPQYKGTFFKAQPKGDEDLRTAEEADFYATPAMKVELVSVSASISASQDAM